MLVGVLVCCWGGIALAWNIATTNPGNSVTAAKLGVVGTPSLVRSPADGASCTSITVSWEAAAEADRYRIERRVEGDWTVLAASHASTSITDTPPAAFADETVVYRITPFYSGSTSWTGEPSTARITCGLGRVDDLALVTRCSAGTLTWSAAEGATRYQVLRSVDMAPFAPVAGDVADTTWVDTTPHAVGANVRYVVRSGDASRTSSKDSNTVTDAGFSPFRILSVTIEDTGTANSVEPGDGVVVKFSEPVDPATPSGTGAETITLARNGVSRGMYLSSSSASVDSSAIAGFSFDRNVAGSGGSVSGTVSWGDGDTTWTWRSTGAVITIARPAWAGTRVGTSSADPAPVTCSDGTTALTETQVVPTGWF